jgi:hypothetical protein
MKTLQRLGYVRMAKVSKPTVLFDRPSMFRTWREAFKMLGWLGLLWIIILSAFVGLAMFVRALWG